MRVCLIFAAFLLTLSQLGTSNAQDIGLSARYIADAQTLSITVKNPNPSSRCIGTVFGANSASTLRRSAKRGVKLVAFKSNKKSSVLSALGVEQLVSKTQKNIFLRANIVCGENEEQSKVVSFKIGSGTGASDPNFANFLVSSRQAFLKSAFTLAPVFSDLTLTKPLDFTQSIKGDKRYLVVEQGGLIKALTPGVTTKAEVLLDVTSLISTNGSERGLLGLALHPNFAKNGFIFVNYTRLADGGTIISRFTVGKNGVADISSEKILMYVAQPFRNHNGGGLAFGPDGYLYIGLGDGGSAGDPQKNGQNRATLLGKFLRIDVDKGALYAIPKTNPYAKNSSGFKPEIWAYGVRNPFRFSFDRKLGNLWAGDVGQGSLEEVDIITKGGNYGWSITEGTNCFGQATCDTTGITPPVFEYGRTFGASITGGYVYRGSANPNYEGVYFFADYVSGRIFALEKIAGKYEGTVLVDTDHFISSFGQDRSGELYLLSYVRGKVFKLQ